MEYENIDKWQKRKKWHLNQDCGAMIFKKKCLYQTKSYTSEYIERLAFHSYSM